MTGPDRWGDLLVAGTSRRREIRLRHRTGVDAVEVHERGRRLAVTFLGEVPEGLTRANIRIEAPAHGVPVTARAVRHAGEDEPGQLTVDLDRRGSAGLYHLRLVERGPHGHPGWAPYHGVDPRFAGAAFSFDPDAPGLVVGSPAGQAGPVWPDQNSYLARDFDALCRAMLGRLSVTMPEWTERHIPDIGITLVELLAYEGDDLSYYQDAVGTESYLQTARQRISIRRHARLAGYRLHEGCNARVWICLEVDADMALPLRSVGFAALGDRAGGDRAGGGSPVVKREALSAAGAVQFFTPLQPGDQPVIRLRAAHNEIGLWSWGEPGSWLVTGATSAALSDEWAEPGTAGGPRQRRLRLQPGDVLIFEATRGPGGVGPADPALRHPVRLTSVEEHVDELYDQPVVTVRWAAADALPFTLLVSAPGPDGEPVSCAAARGNVVLADHGPVVAGSVPVASPALPWPGLCYGCPFPDPVVVGREQASRLRGLFAAWRRRAERWQRAAEDGTPLTVAQLTGLRNLLGAEALERLGLVSEEDESRRRREDDDDRDERRARQEAEALGRMLAHADRLLAGRLDRVEVLATLAVASGPLESVYIDELAEDWGRELTSRLHPSHPATWGPAAATGQDPVAALPLLDLADAPGEAAGPVSGSWAPVLDLLESDPGGRDVVVEVDDSGIGHLRFAADAPLPASGSFTARYRVGSPADGNVPAESINAVVWLGDGAEPAAAAQAAGEEGRRGAGTRRQQAHPVPPDPAGLTDAVLTPIAGVRNPLPASGGTAREPVAAAKLAVPGSYLIGQPRALSAADYAALAENVPGVARAAAQLCWTGARMAADVAIQPAAGEDPSNRLLHDVRAALQPARRIGHDLWVHAPRYRPLLISASVILTPDASRADAAVDLRRRVGSGWLADGSPALFNPERLGFGAPVYASAVVATLQAAPGVTSVTLSHLGFADDPASSPAAGTVPDRLGIGPMEIARLDNDPAAPQNGWAVITLAGGR